MAQRVLAENAGVETVRYVLPNKHYIPVDMKYIGVDNTTPYVCFFSGMFASRVYFVNLFEGTNPFPEISSASCCGAEGDGGWFFLDRCLVLSCAAITKWTLELTFIRQ